VKKQKVIIASVLQAFQNTSALELLFFSLRETNKSLLNIIGFSCKNETLCEDLSYFNLFDLRSV
jgi:hypothetical protein